MMLDYSQNLISSFTTKGCSNVRITQTPRRGYVTVLSGSSGTGGHSSMFVEAYMDVSMIFGYIPDIYREWAQHSFNDWGLAANDLIAATVMVDLTAGYSANLGSVESVAVSSGSSSTGGFDISINASVAQVYDRKKKEIFETDDDYTSLLTNGLTKHTRSYDLDRDKLNGFWNATERFAAKVGRGRYTYRLAGGKLGWLSSLPGQRGINCADFVIKVLSEAGIATISSQLFNTPYRVANRK